MNTRLGFYGAATAVALLLSGTAQAGQGWYVGLAGGGTMIDDIDYAGLRNPDVVTRLEEDRICAFYSGGHLYATADRAEPLV